MNAKRESVTPIAEDDDIGLGNFHPTHHVVLAFNQASQAYVAKTALRNAGFRDIRHISDQQMLSASQRRLDRPRTPATMEASLKLVLLYRQLAEQACHFLLVRAPSEEATQALLQVLRQHPCRLAQKYHRLVIQALQ